MPGYTQEQLDALIAQQGGELGGPGVGRAPLPARTVKTLYPGTGVGDVPPYYIDVPAPTQYRIQTARGDITVEPQEDGTYTLVNAPSAPTGRGTETGAPYITGGQLYDPTKNIFTDIPGYRGTQPQGSWQNGVYYGPPGADIPEALTANPIALQQAQAQEQRLAAAEGRLTQQAAETARQNAFQNQLVAIKAAEAANEIDAKRAQELRDYLYKTEVEFPQKLREQEDVLRGNALTRGQQAGTSAVSDITATLPYRYSPGFQARQQAVQAEAARGNFQPGIYQSIARSYRAPDLQGARQQAERGYENQYLDRFGFDPLEAARGIPYRPQPAGAAPVTYGTDDEDEIKRLAAQLAGR